MDWHGNVHDRLVRFLSCRLDFLTAETESTRDLRVYLEDKGGRMRVQAPSAGGIPQETHKRS
jgi:hypothetical protein